MFDFIKENAKPLTEKELNILLNGKEVPETFDIYDIIAMAQNMKKADPDWYNTSPLGIMHDLSNGDPDRFEFIFINFLKEIGFKEEDFILQE